MHMKIKIKVLLVCPGQAPSHIHLTPGMVIERRYDMLRYERREWKDKLFSVFGALVFFAFLVDAMYVHLSTGWKDFVGATKLFLYHSRGVNVSWMWAVVLISPAISFISALCMSETVLYMPHLIILYGRFLLIILEIFFLLVTMWIWDNNGFAMGAAALSLGFSFTFYLGRDPSIWKAVLVEARQNSDFLHTRLKPTIIAYIIDATSTNILGATALSAFGVWNKTRLLQIHSIMLLVYIWIFHTAVQLILRGTLIAHYTHAFFLAGSEHERRHPVRRSWLHLMTGSFGSIFLAASYYGGRNGVLVCAMLAYNFRMGESPDPQSPAECLGVMLSNLLILYLASSQRFRSLFQIVAYSYSFAESLMLTEVYPSFKIDLVNKFSALLAFINAIFTGWIASILLESFAGLKSKDALRLAMLISIQSLMLSQLIFEPVKAASFTLAVGLVEAPKYLLAKMPWVKAYYPPFA